MKKNFRSRPHSEEGLGLQDRRDVLLQAAALPEPKELHLAQARQRRNKVEAGLSGGCFRMP